MSNNFDKRPIGIFDSGVGGLTVAREIRRLLPHESTVYVGDTARVPYGSKDVETLLNYGREIIRFLLTKNVKAVVLACGTSSANAFDVLQDEFPGLPLIDVLRPGVDACVEMASTRPDTRFGFIATAATVKSGMFQSHLSERLPGVQLHSRVCPLFASMVESGLATEPGNPILRFAAETYLADLRGQIDALVLGCTHYPLLTDILAHILGDIKFINLAQATAQATRDRLVQQPQPAINPIHEFYVSGCADVFQSTARAIFDEECEPIRIDLGRNREGIK